MREGKTVLKKPSELHVLVHPHYSYGKGPSKLGQTKYEFQKAEIRPSTRRVFNEHPDVVQMLKQVEAIDRFYRTQIRRISKTPKAQLVILQSDSAAPRSATFSSCTDYESSIQSRLIQFAQKRLGRRLIVLNCATSAVGEKLKKLFRPTIPVKVFGEYRNFCVDNVALDLSSLGFSQVDVLNSKSVYSDWL